MKASVNSGQSVGTDTSAPDVGDPTVYPDASRKEREKGGILSRRGETPVRVERMRPFLEVYPNRSDARFLESGFRDGFSIPATGFGPVAFVKNLPSVRLRPEVVSDKLVKEVELGRMAGPFRVPPIDDLCVSPLGLVPKKEPNKFRMIHHLSYPYGSSVNDSIDSALCKVVYTSFDAALVWVRRYGPGALMAKTDIEAAFRLLPVHPDSFRYLGCFWDGGYYVDRCLPMGCSVSCAYFEKFSSFLEWVVRRESEVPSVLHYLDDFLFVGPKGSRVCSILLSTMERISRNFGVPLAADKTEGPVTVIWFLGI